MATRFERPQRESLLELLRADGVLPVVMLDIGPHPDDWSLYRIWNRGVDDAIARGAEYICVLNDDVAILPGTLGVMEAFLRHWPKTSPFGVVYPDYRRRTDQGVLLGSPTPTVGTWGAGAMSGFCFMFRADLGIRFDESYHLWYGDDAFEEAVRAKGLLVARIDGLPIDHTPMGSTSQLGDEAQVWIANDRRRWETRQRTTIQHEPETVTA